MAFPQREASVVSVKCRFGLTDTILRIFARYVHPQTGRCRFVGREFPAGRLSAGPQNVTDMTDMRGIGHISRLKMDKNVSVFADRHLTDTTDSGRAGRL